MAVMSLATIIASLHARSGKTSLARVIADYFRLSGHHPYIFDTDSVERKLYAHFPSETNVIDLAEVPDQMILIDTLAKASSETRVVDVTHRSFTKFFDLMRETDFVAEARSRAVEPVIFYIPDRKADSFEAGVELRERFADCRFVVVDNTFLGEPKGDTRYGEPYRILKRHDLHLTMPVLDRDLADAIEEPGLSLSDLMRQPLTRSEETYQRGELTIGERAALRGWVLKLFQEFHRVTQMASTVPDHGP